MNNINKKFRQLRRYLELTQRELSSILNITQGNLSLIENAECLPSCDLLLRLRDKYPLINFNWLLGGDSNMFIQYHGTGSVNANGQEMTEIVYPFTIQGELFGKSARITVLVEATESEISEKIGNHLSNMNHD